jgi:hypothetical protein
VDTAIREDGLTNAGSFSPPLGGKKNHWTKKAVRKGWGVTRGRGSEERERVLQPGELGAVRFWCERVWAKVRKMHLSVVLGKTGGSNKSLTV